MLILGSPGGGKTTTLLHLTLGLIADAETDESAPIPHLVNLSKFRFESPKTPTLARFTGKTNNPDRQTRLFEAWLASEFSDSRKISRTMAAKWIREGRVAALLDGLDEVNDERRADMVRLLNATYLKEHPDSVVFACSRIAEYQPLLENSDTTLELRGAVTLQPLSSNQINNYLEAAEAHGLRDALGHDSSLEQLAQTPLTLSMMTLAYTGLNADEIPTGGSVAERRHKLMETFVVRMLQRKERRARGIPFDNDSGRDVPPKEYIYHPASAARYLSWLAIIMSVRMQTACKANRLYSLLVTKHEGEPTKSERWAIVAPQSPFVTFVCLAACLPFAGRGQTAQVLSAGIGVPMLYLLIATPDICFGKRETISTSC